MFLDGGGIGFIDSYAMVSIIRPVMKNARADQLAVFGRSLGFGEGKYAWQKRFFETRPPTFGCAPRQDHTCLWESLDQLRPVIR